MCNAPGTFQRCMMAIFSDMVEKTIEVFMDDFSILGNSFDNFLENLRLVLIRCEETNLVLNWEKCHFMVQEVIVLRHRISARGIEVYRAKIKAIKKLPPPSSKNFLRLQSRCLIYWSKGLHLSLMHSVCVRFQS